MGKRKCALNEQHTLHNVPLHAQNHSQSVPLQNNTLFTYAHEILFSLRAVTLHHQTPPPLPPPPLPLPTSDSTVALRGSMPLIDGLYASLLKPTPKIGES